MRAQRKQEAAKLRAEGEEQSLTIRAQADRDSTVLIAEAERDAQRLRGEGDADAARIYGKAGSADPSFYAFYRSLEAYRGSMTDGNGVIVLDKNDPSVRRRLPGGGAGRPVPVRRPVRLEAHGRAPAGPAQPGPAQLRRAGGAGRAEPGVVGPAVKR
ncbi:hypothetical protein G6F35_016217 [Rhizopus arrhizus]|nr:hypothetical protein G6F35_016217 [Rhizopus arrhizus]